MEIPPVSAAARCLFFVALMLAPLRGQDSGGVQIAWASDAFATNVMANGTTNFGGSSIAITFEIGAFKQGFDPSASPQSEWAANWVALQSASYDPIESQVIQTATLNSNSLPFLQDSRAYIWGFNTKDTAAGAEWIVLSADSWKWPSTSSPDVKNFSVSDVTKSSEMLMGSVNGSFQGIDYHMRLEAVTNIIPEPAAALLGCVSLMAVSLRRKR